MSHTLEQISLEQIAKKWFSAFNDHNLEALLSLYADDAQHYSPKLKKLEPETRGFINGKEGLGKWWGGAFDRLPTLTYHVRNLTFGTDRIFMEYLRKVHNEPDMLVAEVLELKHGLIVASRVYHG